MSYALSHPTQIQRSSLLAVVVALHACILLLILAARTVAPKIIAMPLIVDLLQPPEPRKAPTPDKPLTLQVSIDADNAIFIGSAAVDRDSLESRFRDAVARDAHVEMHLRADRGTRYESVAEAMSAARRAGLTRIGFITQPGNDPR